MWAGAAKASPYLGFGELRSPHAPSHPHCRCEAWLYYQSVPWNTRNLSGKPFYLYPEALTQKYMDKYIVLFVGARHPPNKRAVDFIEKRLAPRHPEVLFLIVGNVCKKAKKGKKENISCTGVVNYISPYYKAADIALNPVISGGGSNLKMFGYFAAGLPVVSTKKGLRGIDAKPGKDVLVANLRNFSDIIATLIKDKQLQDTLRRNSKKIARQYDWGVIAESALKYYKKVL